MTIKQALLMGGSAIADNAEKSPSDDNIKPFEVVLARNILMTGPRATPPTWRAIRKTIAYMRNGYKDWTRWNWRRAPKLLEG